MKKTLLFVIFLLVAPATLLTSMLSLRQVSKIKAQAIVNSGVETISGAQSSNLYSSESEAGAFNQSISTGEARPLIIKQYLEKHNSPIVQYADTIFEISQKYDLDYRLMIAISQCESNLCKRIPEGSYNCWGFENGETKFSSWEQAFNQVAKTLKEGYYDKGLVTPDQIMPKYAPPALENGGSWAKCVNQFYDELQ